MPKGIVIFGANGCGKTTLGRELSRELKIKHLDAEDYYFEESPIPYSKPRTKEQVISLMLQDIQKCDTFVLTSVTGDYGQEIGAMYRFAVWLTVPLELRLQRVENRSLEQFGARALAGGDRYEEEQKFLEFVKNRDLGKITEWAENLTCPILHLDGSKAISESVSLIVEQYRKLK